MKYKVIREFKDLQDNNHIYRVGNKYPRSGRVKNERIKELSGYENKRNVPLIKEVEDNG
ncbi:hypothetical protein [Priestia flexa]|jgi:hypothetical protein|uniref:Uncharacterized protein n=1 Tax=Priestia flexa TaxID=86664 RepID=A0A8I1MKA2_9BACI|nr:hypothetical protein [Priestia flexa]MBN8253604.1 hypothetical protein [Priestia flexa]